MKLKHWIGCAGILAGLTGLCSPAGADVYLGKGASRREIPTIKSASDAVEKLPLVSRIPKSFLVGDGFKFKLSADALRIDHMGLNSKATPQKRTCMLGFSFASPVAFFGSRIEIPLFYSEHIRLSRWQANTPGDYVIHLSKDSAVKHPTFGLSATARF